MEKCRKAANYLLAGMEMKGASGCPFYSPMYITRADGKTGVIWPATDSCNIFLSEQGCFNMGEGDNEAFWSLFGNWQNELTGEK